MKVLWLVSVTLPAAAQALGVAGGIGGGWLCGMLEQLKGRVELAVCAVNSAVTAPAFAQVQGVRYALLPQGERADFEALLARLQPDLVHIWGTEYPAASRLLEAAGPERTLISIQGLMGPCAAHLTDGVPPCYLGSSAAQRAVDRLVPGGLLDKQQSFFDAQAEREAQLLSRALHVSGRTAWDREQLTRLAPRARYYFCGEVLRSSFYDDEWQGGPGQPVLFLSQGNYPLKGLHRLLQALPSVQRHWPGLKLRVAGWPPLDKGPALRPVIEWMFPYQRYLHRLARQLGLKNTLEYTGPLGEAAMKQAYLSSSIFLLCSSVENSPNSLGEAMLLGMPCIASDAGGTASLLQDGRDGLLYPAQDLQALASAILRLLEDPALARRLGQNARARAQEAFSPAANSAAMLAIYKTICKEV